MPEVKSVGQPKKPTAAQADHAQKVQAKFAEGAKLTIGELNKTSPKVTPPPSPQRMMKRMDDIEAKLDAIFEEVSKK